MSSGWTRRARRGRGPGQSFSRRWRLSAIALRTFRRLPTIRLFCALDLIYQRPLHPVRAYQQREGWSLIRCTTLIELIICAVLVRS